MREGFGPAGPRFARGTPSQCDAHPFEAIAPRNLDGVVADQLPGAGAPAGVRLVHVAKNGRTIAGEDDRTQFAPQVETPGHIPRGDVPHRWPLRLSPNILVTAHHLV